MEQGSARRHARRHLGRHPMKASEPLMEHIMRSGRFAGPHSSSGIQFWIIPEKPSAWKLLMPDFTIPAAK